MQKSTLEALNQQRTKNRSIVLITELATGGQFIYFKENADNQNQLSATLTSHAETAIGKDQCAIVVDAGEEFFLHPFNPSLRAIIIGAVHIAQELIPMLQRCHYQVCVIDPRETFATSARFPEVELINQWPDQGLDGLNPDHRTAIITLTHDPRFDDPALVSALHSEAFYIGALGSNRTQEARSHRLLEHGIAPEQLERIHGPVGLDINAQSPAEIAVSILAEMTLKLRSDQPNAV